MQFVIFDIDGTLTDTTAVDDKCFIHAFQQTFDLDISKVAWSSFKNVTDRGISEEIFQREFGRLINPEEYTRFVGNLEKLFLAERESDVSQFQEVNGASAFYDIMKEDPRYYIGIATGSCKETALIKLSQTNIILDAVPYATSNDAKERENVMLHTINQMKEAMAHAKHDILYFGDGVWDYKACQNLGVKFIGIDHKGNGKLKRIGAEYVFKDFSHAEEILKLI